MYGVLYWILILFFKSTKGSLILSDTFLKRESDSSFKSVNYDYFIRKVTPHKVSVVTNKYINM